MPSVARLRISGRASVKELSAIVADQTAAATAPVPNTVSTALGTIAVIPTTTHIHGTKAGCPSKRRTPASTSAIEKLRTASVSTSIHSGSGSPINPVRMSEAQ
ncbi:hypothetical protein ACVOMT_13125 [Sphingomonas panni]